MYSICLVSCSIGSHFNKWLPECKGTTVRLISLLGRGNNPQPVSHLMITEITFSTHLIWRSLGQAGGEVLLMILIQLQ